MSLLVRRDWWLEAWLEEVRLAIRAVAERERRDQFHARLPVKPFKHGPLPEPKHSGR